MNILLRRYLGRTEFVEGLVEEWKRDHDDAMFAVAVDELVAECIDLGNLSKHAWGAFRQLLIHDPNAPIIDESGLVLMDALTKTLAVFQDVSVLRAEAIRRGHSIKDDSSFVTVLGEIKKINATVQEVFAPPDPKMIEESIAAFKRGECHTIEELIRAAQDGRFPPRLAEKSAPSAWRVRYCSSY